LRLIRLVNLRGIKNRKADYHFDNPLFYLGQRCRLMGFGVFGIFGVVFVFAAAGAAGLGFARISAAAFAQNFLG
jgi:hypothetical protein